MNDTVKEVQDNISAIDIMIAFDYQYYVFLLNLFSLNKGESVGLEVKDDVHTELSNDRQILCQVKHTVKKNATGTPIALTTLDKDFWKTLSNWIQIITDKNANRENIKSQLDFIKKTTFLFFTNKSITNRNEILKTICEFQDGTIDFLTLKFKFKYLEEKTASMEIKNYINNVTSKNDNIIEEFVKKIDVKIDKNPIIEQCKIALESKLLTKNQAEIVFDKLYSKIKEDNFTTVKDGGKVIFSYDSFMLKYRKYIDQARNPNFTPSTFEGQLCDFNSLKEQLFIKQLIDIDIIDDDDDDEITDYTRSKLGLRNSITKAIQLGDLTETDKDNFDKKTLRLIKIQHKSNHLDTNSELDSKKNAMYLYANLINLKFDIDEYTLSQEFSNAQLHFLSNIPKIGWEKDWKNKYENK